MRPEETTAKHPGLLERFARWAAVTSGSSMAFALAVLCIVVWAATGPYFDFVDTWQLVINTSTTIITFLMVFLIQRSQNKEALAIQLKLNELVAAVHGASNRLINVEDLSEEDVVALHSHYKKLAELTKREHNLTCSHSIDEAQSRHRRKAQPTAAERAPGTASAAAEAGHLSADEHELHQAIRQLEDALHHHEKYLTDLKGLLLRQSSRLAEPTRNGAAPQPGTPVG